MNAPKLRRSPSGVLMIERFSLQRRIEHVFGIIVFTTLVVTGLPQKFDTSELGHALIVGMGGLEVTRALHRVAGIIFGVHAILHLLVGALGVITGRMRAAMVPVPQDLRDAHENLRYFFGKRSTPPALPKYDYRQKFEYVGMVLGGLLMVGSGVMLLYPLEFVKWVPGALIPAALVAHSSEAVLALLVLVVWHIYTVVLSPDVFPIDQSMFTGYMPVHELAHHHRREYERLFPDGLPEIDAPRPASAEAPNAPPEAPEAPPAVPPARLSEITSRG